MYICEKNTLKYYANKKSEKIMVKQDYNDMLNKNIYQAYKKYKKLEAFYDLYNVVEGHVSLFSIFKYYNS